MHSFPMQFREMTVAVCRSLLLGGRAGCLLFSEYPLSRRGSSLALLAPEKSRGLLPTGAPAARRVREADGQFTRLIPRRPREGRIIQGPLHE
jgi:hypothetical protein